MKRNTLSCESCIATVSNNSYSLHSATIFTHTIGGGRKGGPKTAKPHRNMLKYHKPHRIFPEYRNRTYMEAHYMKADVTGLRNSNLRVIAAKEVLLELVHL